MSFQEEHEYMHADAACDRAETLRWKRELEEDEWAADPTIENNGDGSSGWPR